MEPAKKIVFENTLASSKNEDEKVIDLEKLVVDEYVSIASNSISRSDTSQLQSFINKLEKDDFPQDSLTELILYRSKKLLEMMGYTGEFIQSQSSRKLSKQKAIFETDLAKTYKQLDVSNKTLFDIKTYISQENISLDTLSDTLYEKNNELKKIETSIVQFKEKHGLSLDPKHARILTLGEKKSYLLINEIKGIQTNYDTSQDIIAEYESRRDKELIEHYFLESDKHNLSSLIRKTDLSLNSLKNGSSLKILASNKQGITSSYKLENELLDKEYISITQYNDATKHVGSYTTFSKEINEKRDSLPKISR